MRACVYFASLPLAPVKEQAPGESIVVLTRHLVNDPKRQRAFVAAAAVALCVGFAQSTRFVNETIGYANGFNCDSWYFLGLQLDFARFYDAGAYQSLRFPAILPWSYLGEVLPYEALNAFKFLTYATLTSVGFMWFSMRLYGVRVAVLTTVLFCCSTAFLGVLSHDYLTAAGLAWISLLLGASVEAGRSRFVLPWSILAGALYAMCFYTHLPTGLFVFAVPLLFFAVAPDFPHSKRRRFAIHLAGCVAGFVTISTVFGLYNLSLGGSFIYIGPQIEIALEAERSFRSAIGFESLFRTEGIVPIIVTALVGSTILVVQERRRLAGNARAIAGITCLVTSAFVLSWELSGRVLLQQNVYAPWVYPVLFAGLGAMLSRVSSIQTMSKGAFLGAVGAIIITLFAAAATTRDANTDEVLLRGKIAAGATFLMIFAAFAKKRYGSVVLLPLTCLVVFSFPTNAGAGSLPIMYGSAPWYAESHLMKEMTLQAAKAVDRYRSLKIEGIPAFWIGASQPEVVAVPRSYLQCLNFAGSFPDKSVGNEGLESWFGPFGADTIQGTQPPRAHHLRAWPRSGPVPPTLVVVANGTRLGQQAARSLRDMGVASTIVGEWPIGSGELRTSMAVLKLQA
jgi:hypothetical protein